MIKSIRQESQELWQENKEEFLFLANSWLEDYNNSLKIIESGK
jgi:hypothetical protein